MRIVYFGSDVFLPCFEYFLEKHQILALYTYHNPEDYFTDYAISRRARKAGISVHYESITPAEITRYFTEEGCQLFFIAEYNRILQLPENLPSFRGINTHNSLLPQGRSYYPIEAAMERELSRTGVTMHKLASQLDKGDILAHREIPITNTTDSIDLYLYCAACAREMIEDIVTHFDRYWAEATVQKEKEPYWKRPAEELLTLTHDMDRAGALEMFRRYNAMTQVEIDGTWYHVTDLSGGGAPLLTDTVAFSPTQLLYRVRDGHLRLALRAKEELT